MNEVVSKLTGYKPLVYIGDMIVLGRINDIFVADMRLERIEHVCTVGKLDGLIRFLSRYRLCQRLLRLEMGPATPLDEKGCFLVFFDDRAYHVDIERRLVRPEVVYGLNKRPHQMLLIQSGEQKGTVLFGEYRLNIGYDPVNIFRRNRNGIWDVAFIFPKGEVNHIHGVFEDAQRECLYILTGDFGQSACIWVADLELTNVRPLMRVGQMSRACWIQPWNNKLIYATDQQENFNYLCMIESCEGDCITMLFPIAGSSIYFSSTHSNPIVFSTTVEPESSNEVTLKMLLSNRRATGILSDKACVYVGTPERGFQIIFSGEKDCLPFGLFQFGSIRFPTGTSPDQNYVHFYCSALTGHDGTMYTVKLNSKS